MGYAGIEAALLKWRPTGKSSVAGHSKWANIRFRKALQDARRGKLFTRLLREISVAASSLADPAANPRLRSAIDRAQQANVSRDNIARAVARGSGEAKSKRLEEILYEGYGPSGMAVLVEALTDNRNRTAAAVRHAFTRAGGQLADNGAVAHLFRRCGELILKAASVDEEQLVDVAVAAGAEEVERIAEDGEDAGCWQVLTPVAAYNAVSGALGDAGMVALRGGLVCLPHRVLPLEADHADVALRLLAALEALDDVQNLYCNASFPDGLLAAD